MGYTSARAFITIGIISAFADFTIFDSATIIDNTPMLATISILQKCMLLERAGIS